MAACCSINSCGTTVTVMGMSTIGAVARGLVTPSGRWPITVMGVSSAPRSSAAAGAPNAAAAVTPIAVESNQLPTRTPF